MNYKFYVNDIVSNYQDSIKNVIYNLQKYSDELIGHGNYYSMETDQMLDDDFVWFLVCESENIMNNKILHSSNEICNIVQGRFNILMKRLQRVDDESNFNYSEKEFNDFYSLLKEVIRVDSILVKHKKSMEKLSSNVFNFNALLENVDTTHKYDISVMSRDKLISYLSNVFDYSSTILYGLKVLIEGCSSCTISAAIIHDMIKCMYASCKCINSISIFQDK